MSSPFTEAHAELFDDGVDLIADPTGLEGQWEADWTSDLERRIEEADLIFVGLVRTVQVEVDLSQNESYRVVVGVDRRMKGDPRQDELSLKSRADSPGHPTLGRNQEQMLDKSFVVFVKRALEAGAVVSHFHMTPPSTPVLERLDSYENPDRGRRIKVIKQESE